jgi:Mg2+ and Co2+ transporter CorA
LNWLKNIFGGNRGKDEPSSLKLAEIDSWISEFERDFEFAKRLDEIYSQIETSAKSLSDEVFDLAKADVIENTPPKLLRAGLAARGEVVKQLSSLSSKLAPPKKRDLDSAFQHHWTALKGLERTATTFARAQRFVAALFPKNIERINSELAGVSRILVDLEAEIGKKRKTAEESWFSRELADRLSDELRKIDELKKKVNQDEIILGELKGQLSTHEDEAKRHSKSDVGKRAEELKRSLERAKLERAQAEEELAGLIAPLTKALARIMKQGSSDRIRLQNESVFLQLLKSPKEVDDKDIAGSLQELRSHLATLGLKDKKKEKTLDQIDLLIEERALEKARARQASLENEISSLDRQIKESSREGQRIKEEISQKKKSIKSIDAGLIQTRRDLDILEEKAAADEKELVERLSKIAGRQIKLDLFSGSK